LEKHETKIVATVLLMFQVANVHNSCVDLRMNAAALVKFMGSRTGSEFNETRKTHGTSTFLMSSRLMA
tara:strand:+ start:2588 stop:2791 length:204 start_codon:yes stop_codon:yes gene_type:complete